MHVTLINQEVINLCVQSEYTEEIQYFVDEYGIYFTSETGFLGPCLWRVPYSNHSPSLCPSVCLSVSKNFNLGINF
jgi:hypothetical protein